MTVANVAAHTQQPCASAAPRKLHVIPVFVSDNQSHTRSMRCHHPRVLHLANESVARLYGLRDPHTRGQPSVTEDHNSDKQSHDVCENCNTSLLQLPFHIVSL